MSLKFEFVALDLFDGEQVGGFVVEGLVDVAEVAGEFAHTVGFEGGGVVGAFPGAVEGEVAFDPFGAECHGGGVGGNAEMVTGEADGFDLFGKVFPQAGDFEEADVFEGDGVAGGAAVDDEILVALTLGEEFDDLFFFFLCGHAEGEVDFTAIVFAEIVEHLPVEIAGGGNFDERWVELCDFFGGGGVPYRGAVGDAVFFAPFFELAVLVEVEFEEFAVGTIGFAVGVHGVGMRGGILIGCEEFFVAAFLKFNDIGFAEDGGGEDEFVGDFHVAFVVTTDFGDYFGGVFMHDVVSPK